MTISPTQLAQILSESELKRFWRGYFQESLREQVQQGLLDAFERLKSASGFSRADLARKIERRPEQVTRWLSSPSNLELDTISDLALGMGVVPQITFHPAETMIKADLTNRKSAFDFVDVSSPQSTATLFQVEPIRVPQ